MFEENIADWKFLKEQTDFGYLVRTDTQRYLRQTDVEGAGREDQMYQWVPRPGPASWPTAGTCSSRASISPSKASST